MNPRATFWRTLLLLAALLLSNWAQAFVIPINPGARALYLRVGDGNLARIGNNIFLSNNPTQSQVSATVPASQLGNGVSQAMPGNVATSDGCGVDDIVVSSIYRRPGNQAGMATLVADASLPLNVSPADIINVIPFTQIRWVSTDTSVLPSGTFTGSTNQFLASFPGNSYSETCLSFFYANTNVVAAGTYNGEVTYTLSAP